MCADVSEHSLTNEGIVTNCYTFLLAFNWDYAIVQMWRDVAHVDRKYKDG